MGTELDRIARRLALGQAGVPVKPTPSRKPAKLAGVIAALNAASAKLPPPPAPMPAPARQPPRLTSVALQRGSDGRLSGASIATANGSRHDITVAQRDELGRLAVIAIDGRRAFRAVRGGYGQIVGLVPIEDAPIGGLTDEKPYQR